MTTKQCNCGFQAQNNFCSMCGASFRLDIFSLVLNGKYDELKQALGEYSYDLEARDETGKTALIYAALRDKPYCLQLLLEHKAHTETKSKFGNTALLLAARDGKTKCVKILLEHNADILTKNAVEETALIAAVKSTAGAIDLLVILLDHRADIEAKDETGRTALEWAAAFNKKEFIKLLLVYGAVVSPETRKKYPHHADLWPEEKPSLTDLLIAVDNIQQQLAAVQDQIKQMQ